MDDEPVTRPNLPAFSRESTVLRLSNSTSLEDLSPSWAWGGATGSDVRVAVVDSGIDADHPDLDGCVEVDKGLAVSVDSGGNPTDTVGPHGDDFGHGTACAGIIHGIAPDARITSVKVLGGGLTGRAAAFIRGLGWAVDEGFEVINLSLGATKRDWALPFYEICDRGYFRNSFIVTAASNVGQVSFPSLFASVASVACNVADDPFRFHYNPDPPTEFLARGVNVDVAWVNGGRVIGTGNSYAAANLAGVAALIRSKHPQLRPFQIKTILWATAANVREAPVAAGRITRALRPGGLTMRATSAMRREQ